MLIASSIGRAASSRSGTALIACASCSGSCIASRLSILVEHAGLDALEAEPALEMAAERTRAARMLDGGQHLLGAAVGQQVEQQRGTAVGGDLVAQQGREAA